MAAIENLEIVVDVDISSALAALEDLQEELQDLAESIEAVDARGTEGIDIRTSLDDLDAELAALEAEIQSFEAASDITIPVEFERSNLDRITSTLRNLQSTSVQMGVEFDTDTEAVESAKETIQDFGADLGLADLGDGELAVRNMRVAAADVTVIGEGADSGTAEAIMDVLSGFDMDEGRSSDLDVGTDDDTVSDLKKPLMGPGFLTMDSPTAADPGELRAGMGQLFGTEDETDVGGAAANAQRLLDAIEETQSLGDAMKNVRKTTTDLDAELEGFEKDLGDTRMRMARMEASRAPNTGELFEMLGRDQDSIVADIDRGGGGGGFDFDFGDSDAMQKLRRSFSKLTSQTGDARDAMSRFDLRMSDLHNLMATLVPLLIVFIGTIPAVVTALVGLAAAAIAAAAGLAAITGFGAMGVAMEGGQFNMQNLTEVWQDIQDSFIEAFAPLAERLEPLFRDAVDGLELFFQAIANQGGALMELTDEARAFGSFLMDFVPGALRTLAAVAEALSPILADVGQAINEGFRPAMRELVRLTEAAMPAVSDLIQTIIAALPTLVEISIQFAQVATAALDAIGLIWNLVTIFGLLDEQIGFLIATGLTLLTFLGLLVKILGPLITLFRILTFSAIKSFVVAMGAAIKATILFAASLLKSAISAIWSFAASIVSAIPALTSYTIAQYAATAALASFITLATLGAGIALVGMAMSAAGAFMGLAGSIDSATNSLKEFDRVSGNTEGDFNPYGGDDPPTSGAAAAGGRGSRGRGNGTTVINVESSGDPQEDRSNAKYVSFRQGRTTGGNN